MNADTQTHEHVLSIDELGQQARGQIRVAEKHDMQSTNAWLAAGLLLIEAKKRRGHGGWLLWLAQHRINERQARFAMQIANSADPHKEVMSERERTREAKRESRAKSASRHADLSPEKSGSYRSTSPNVAQFPVLKAPATYRSLTPENQKRVQAHLDEYVAQLYREQCAPKLLTK